MSKARYAVGDYIFLISGPVGLQVNSRSSICCRMPEEGEAQYRVQSRQESFERRIRAGEIDAERSAAPEASADLQGSGKRRSWVNTTSIRVNK